jgi:hypothetical protein
MTELLTASHPPSSYAINQPQQQQQQQQQQQPGQFTPTEQHPVDLSNSQQRPPNPAVSAVASAAFYGLSAADYNNSAATSSNQRRGGSDSYKPNGLSLSLGIPDSGKFYKFISSGMERGGGGCTTYCCCHNVQGSRSVTVRPSLSQKREREKKKDGHHVLDIDLRNWSVLSEWG